jgi:hypothetical protein
MHETEETAGQDQTFILLYPKLSVEQDLTSHPEIKRTV